MQGQSDRPQLITVQDMVEVVRMPCDIIGRIDRTVSRPAPISDSAPECVSFYSKSADKAAAIIGGSKAGVVLCAPEAAAAVGACDDRTVLLVSNPRLAFIRVMNAFFAPEKPVGIHPTAVIHPEAELGERVYIGPFCHIGKVCIGDRTVIEGHAHIYRNVCIGSDCLVQSHVVLGAASLGLERNESGEYERSPEIGGVLIGDNVVIGTFSRVDRGTMSCTVVEDGVKLDSHVGVGHNCHVGQHAGLASYTWMAGSSRVEDHCWVSAHACLREGVVVGRGATVGMGAVVTRDVRPGTTVFGVPARERRSGS